MVIITSANTDELSGHAVGRDDPGVMRAVLLELQGAVALISICLILVLIGLHLS